MNLDSLDRNGLATRLDRVISNVAPLWGMRRIQARAKIQQAELSMRRFEGASSGRRTRGWITSNGSANAEAQTGLSKLRARSRDLRRNNSWARKAIGSWASTAVGAGITPSFTVKGTASLGDDIAALWEQWANSTSVDPEGRLNFYGMQHIATAETAEAGEVLFRSRTRRAGDGLLVPFQLQPLEADFLDDLKTGADNAGRRMIQGVEYGSLGQRLAYWLYRDHPGELSYPIQLSSSRVPSNQVLHLFRPDRFGQARGIPWGASCLLTLRDFDSYADAQLMRQRIAAMFVGFVVSTDADDLADTVADPGEADEFNGQQDFEPGTWEHLPLGRDIRFSNPPKIDDFADYSRVTLRQVAAGYDVPYEVLSGDLSNINFHGGKLGRIEYQAAVETYRRLFLIPQFCEPVARRFLTIAVLQGLLPDMAAHASITWTPPMPKMLEPVREIKAQKDAVRAGFKTRGDVIRELSGDPTRVFRERAEEDAKLRELGLNFDDTPLPEEDLEEDLREEIEAELADKAGAPADAEQAREAKKEKGRTAEIALDRD